MNLDADLDVPYWRQQYQSRQQNDTLQPYESRYYSGGASSNIHQFHANGVDAKVVVMGNSAVGKSSLVHRFAHDKFSPASTTSTTGAFFVTKKLMVDGLRVRLQLWDTAGQERFRSMAPMYYRGAHAAILVYDITDASTFADLRRWLEELRSYHPLPTQDNDSEDNSLIIYIVGTKADLHSKRAITPDYARRTLREWFPPLNNPELFPSTSSSPTDPTSPPTPPPSRVSYIRPRFLSLTSFSSSPSVPTLNIHAITSSATTPLSPIPSKPAALTRASSAMVVPTRASQTTHRLRERRWSEVMMMRETLEEEEARHPTSPSGTGTDTPPSSSHPLTASDGAGDNCADEPSLQPGMELFEVSAKDGGGVEELFSRLVREIVKRRDAIIREKEQRERGSVYIGAVEREEEDEGGGKYGKGGKAKQNGWSCCST